MRSSRSKRPETKTPGQHPQALSRTAAALELVILNPQAQLPFAGRPAQSEPVSSSCLRRPVVSAYIFAWDASVVARDVLFVLHHRLNRP